MKKFASAITLVALVATGFWSPLHVQATNVPEPDTCNEEYTYTFSSGGHSGGDDSSKPGNIDFINTLSFGNPDSVTVTADTGFAITKVELSVDDDGVPGFALAANGPVSNFNPNPGTTINVAKVTVKKVCETTPPTVVVQRAVGQDDPTSVSPINFKVTFSEPVSGFDEDDLDFGGTALGALNGDVTGDAAVYNVEVTGMTSSGTVTLDIPAHSAKDAADNWNTASDPEEGDHEVFYEENQIPVPEDQEVETDKNEPVDIELGASDPDGDPIVGWDLITDFLDGDLTGTPPNVTFTPDEDFVGSTHFSFNVSDGMGTSTTAGVVDIDVNETYDDCDPGYHQEGEHCVPDEVPGQCVVVSDETTLADGELSVPTYIHPVWTKGLDPENDGNVSGAQWIWNAEFAQQDELPETVTFTKTFSVTDVPSSATLEIASDNSYTVLVNGVAPSCDGSQENNFSAVESCPITLLAGENELEFTVTNKPPANTPENNPSGLIYKVTAEDVDCGEPAPEGVTIVASKIVCTDESQLPNWGTGSAEGLERPITEDTAENWVETHETCSLVPGWEFEVGDQNASDPGGDFFGIFGSGYTKFGPTDEDGVAIVEYPLEEGTTELHLREVLKHGFIPFTFDQENQSNEDDVSAEFYCSNDVLNYDNWDFIREPQVGETYYCVAWNVPDESQCNPEASSVLLSSDDDGEELLTQDEDGPASLVAEPHDSWFDPIDALWIWKDSSTSNEDADLGTVETFTRTFEIEGTPTGATLDIAVDNSVVVEINGDEFISIPGEHNYEAIASYPISADWLVGGENEITFTVTNMNHDSANDPSNNPAGLLYKLTVHNDECTPYEPEEPEEEFGTVTMCKTDEHGSPLSGWSLFLKGESVQQDLAIPVGNPNGVDSVALDDSLSYLALASGLWRNAGQGPNFVDAEYSTVDPEGATNIWTSVVDGFTGYGTDILELQINEAFDPNADWGPFSSSHEYARSFTVASDGPANFRIFDGSGTTQNESWFGDNVESNLAVDLYKGYAGVTDEEGCVTFENVPHGEYTLGEIAQEGWNFDSAFDGETELEGLAVSVDSEDETFTIRNEAPEQGDGNGTLVIAKYARGGDEVFDFEIDDGDESITSKSVSTSGGHGTTTLVLPAGTYTITELDEESWNFVDVTCTYDGESAGVEVEHGETVQIGEGDTVICTFTNMIEDSVSSGGGSHQDDDDDNDEPSVLGAMDESCDALLTTYLGKNYPNPADEVVKLQNFLNGEMGSGLPVTGTFGPMTEAAVRAFQVKYWEDVLKPWFAFPEYGVNDSDDSTGIVYKTTKWKINDIFCPGSEELPTLP